MAFIREGSIVFFEENAVKKNQGFGRVLKIYKGSCLVEILISDIEDIEIRECLNKLVLSKKNLSVYSEERMLQSELYSELLLKKEEWDSGKISSKQDYELVR